MHTRHRFAAVVLVSAAAVTGCASSSHTPETSPAAGIRAVRAARLPPAGPESELISTVPGHFTEEHGTYGGGPVTLADAVRQDGAAGAMTALTTDQFQRGFEKVWLGGKGAQIDAALYEFASPRGALAYHRRSTTQSLHSGAGRVQRFAVPGVPGSQAVGLYISTRTLRGALVEAQIGRYLMEVDVSSGSKQGVVTLAVTLAKAQARRL